MSARAGYIGLRVSKAPGLGRRKEEVIGQPLTVTVHLAIFLFQAVRISVVWYYVYILRPL